MPPGLACHEVVALNIESLREVCTVWHRGARSCYVFTEKKKESDASVMWGVNDFNVTHY